MNKPKINKCISLTISKDKSLLDILDSVEDVEEHISKDYINKNNICKCCNKYIANIKTLGEHQIKCFQNKINQLNKTIEELNIQMSLLRENVKENVKHDIRIKGIELLLERNNDKWNKIYNLKK